MRSMLLREGYNLDLLQCVGSEPALVFTGFRYSKTIGACGKNSKDICDRQGMDNAYEVFGDICVSCHIRFPVTG